MSPNNPIPLPTLSNLALVADGHIELTAEQKKIREILEMLPIDKTDKLWELKLRGVAFSIDVVYRKWIAAGRFLPSNSMGDCDE